MKPLILTCLCTFVLLPAACFAQAAIGPFTNVPTDHSAYTAVEILESAGIVLGHPDGTYSSRPMTRYGFAVAIACLLSQIHSGDLALYADLVARLQKSPATLNALQYLVNEFTPELELLGQNAAVYQARLAALTPQFPDVPKNHWASAAVLTLRQDGIMQGYPSGTMTTSAKEENIP